MNNIFNNKISFKNGYPSGIGERTIEKASCDWYKNWNILQEILSDVRYSETKTQTKGETNMKEKELESSN